MLVNLDDSIFADPSPWIAVDLISILRNTRHLVLADDTTKSYLKWAAEMQVPALRLKRYMAASALQVRSGYGRRKVTIHTGTSNWKLKNPLLSLADAKTFLSFPFKVFVENANADRAFLFAYMDKNDRDYFEELEQKSWLQFIHGGGTGDLQKQVENEINVYPRAELRVFAMFDNDGLAPGKFSAKTIQLSTVCTNNKVEHHRLNRRAIENYVHHFAISEYAKNLQRRRATWARKALDSFKKLTDDEKDFFNMKAGIRGDKGKAPGQQYSNSLKPHEERWLEIGFGKNLARVFHYPHFSQKSNNVDYIRAAAEVRDIVLKAKVNF